MWSHSGRYKRLDINTGFMFKCTRCAKCCSTGPNVALTVFDVIRLAEYLNKHWRTVITDYMKVIIGDMVPFIALRGENNCIFLRYVNGIPHCEVYPARPLRCRLYPLHLTSPSSRILDLDLWCPGVNHGNTIYPPRKLIEHYSWEVKEHYFKIMDLVLNKGFPPLRALEKVLDDLWIEAEEKKPLWVKVEFIEGLGST